MEDIKVAATGGGTCLQVEDDLPPEVEKLPVIDCARPHNYEIYAEIKYVDAAKPNEPVDVYPGISALESFAQKACFEAFEPFVGISPFDSRLVPTWLLPTLDGWKKDHNVLCVLADPERETMTDSMTDAGQAAE